MIPTAAPGLTAAGLVGGDHMYPHALAVARVDTDQRVRMVMCELMEIDMGWTRTLQYTAATCQQYGPWVVSVDVSTLGRVQRWQLSQELKSWSTRSFNISERIVDLSGRDPSRDVAIREATSYAAALIDTGQLRTLAEHESTAALSRFQARQTRPDEDEQRFASNDDYSYVMATALAVGKLDPTQQAKVYAPTHQQIPRNNRTAQQIADAAAHGGGIVGDVNELIRQAEREFFGRGRRRLRRPDQ